MKLSFVQLFSGVFLVLSLSACGPLLQTMQGYPLPSDFRPIGIQQTSSVGEVMTSSLPSILHHNISTKKLLEVEATHRNEPVQFSASPGRYTMVGENPNGSFYQSTDGSFKIRGGNAIGGIYLPSNDLSAPALYWQRQKNFVRGWVHIAPLEKIPEFEKLEDTWIVSECTKLSPRVTTSLHYSGVANGQIKFVYREYTDCVARDAYTQNVSLDYVPETTYAYKSARFIVHSADTVQISYTLLAPL